jgi:hypothetical protein
VVAKACPLPSTPHQVLLRFKAPLAFTYDKTRHETAAVVKCLVEQGHFRGCLKRFGIEKVL